MNIKFRPLLTADEVVAAFGSGDVVEFTAYSSDSCDMPPHDADDSGGWILSKIAGNAAHVQKALDVGCKFRAPRLGPEPMTPTTPNDRAADSFNVNIFTLMHFIDLRFQSGNGVAVERAHIKREEWQAIKAELLARSGAKAGG